MKPQLILVLILACTGCTLTRIQTPQLTLRRFSFLQRVEIPRVEMNTNGMITMTGYKNDGGNEAAAGIISAAVTAAIKSVAP